MPSLRRGASSRLDLEAEEHGLLAEESVAMTSPAFTYWPVSTVRVWMMPSIGARTNESRRLSSAVRA